VRDLDARLADDAVITADCGHNTGLTAQYVQIRKGQAFGVSGTLASHGRAACPMRSPPPWRFLAGRWSRWSAMAGFR
jgi:hypothetical protein